MYKKYISFLLLLISTLSFGQNIHFQAIGVENGISQPTVTSIYQDEFGIIWIGTKDGLNRYNGTDFHIFRPIENDKNSLYNNNIGTICGDKNGHIYIRCKYAVVEYDIRKNIFKSNWFHFKVKWAFSFKIWNKVKIFFQWYRIHCRAVNEYDGWK